jgi:hypothetical protein
MEEKEEKKETAPTEGETPKKSNRDTFMERYKADYPDDNFEDEEAMYGRMNERNAAYDRLKTNDDNFRKLVNEHPEYGGMVADMMEGRNFIESFLGRHSLEDIEAAYNDPEMAKKLSDEYADWMQKKVENEKFDKEREANVQNSIKELSAYCEENGIDEEGATELWGKALDFANNAVMLLFDKSFYDFLNKGMNHDNDVAAAREEGEIAGHNAKVQTQLAKGQGPDGIPPTFDGGQGAAAPEAKPVQKKKFYNPFSHEMEEA